MTMTEEALLELIDPCLKQIEEMIPDDYNLDECRKWYKKYMDTHEQLLAINFDKYADKVVSAYYTLIDIYYALEELEDEDAEAENLIELLTKVLAIHKKLAQKDAKYLKSIVEDYNEMGEVYEGIGNEKKAEKMYDEADKIMKKIK